jgi:hypothetical protein
MTRLALSLSLALALTASADAGGRTPRSTPPVVRAPRPVVVPAFPQYYIKAHDGSAIPVVPVFVVPVTPAPPPAPAATPACYRFFCD